MHSQPLSPVVTPEFCVVARHPAALARRQRWLAFGLAAVVSVVVAGSFVAAGAWPVLPYTLIELAVLGGAFLVLERRARDWERLTVRGDRVIVERRVGGRAERREFNRLWLRVEVERRAAHDPHLQLRFAGEAMPFGDALPAARRLEVARTLRRLTAH